MNKKVFNYFVDLDKQNLIRDAHGVIIENSSGIKKFGKKEPQILFIGNNVFFSKVTGDIDDNLQSIVASDLYNQVGILNPPIYLSKDNKMTIPVKQITQDIRLPQFYDCRHPGNSDYYDFLRLKMPFNQAKWKVLYDRFLKDYFLSFMTDECFDEFINMFLLDELRSETDRHVFNYFLYKNKKSYKYEGIIALDFDLVEILTEDCLKADAFKEFLKRKYSSVAPATNEVYDNYSNSINRIKKLITLDKLNKNNIATLKKGLKYDFPNNIKHVGKKHNLSDNEINRIYTPYAYLWDYNRKEIGKELGI